MKKYTANYTYTNPNFVIQNLVANQQNTDLLPLLSVIKNILQRGFPTILSKYLQGELGEIHKAEDFQQRFLFASDKTPLWQRTIKGDRERNYYPAKDFFENIIPEAFGPYAFVQSLIIPEIQINEITGEENRDFINQQVDFYLPQAKLVIEIDGQQHKLDEVTRVSDAARDSFLSQRGIATVRITTRELKNGAYLSRIDEILKHLERSEKQLSHYRKAFNDIKNDRISPKEAASKLVPTAVMRFQILLIDLLMHRYLRYGQEWNFNILCHEDLPEFARLAIEDLHIWISRLSQLKDKRELPEPVYNIRISSDPSQFVPDTKSVNIDFSLFRRYTDENEASPDVIFVRTDYFDNAREKNYFRVSTAEPVNYRITEDDKPVLEFFLENIFGKTSFREGQYPIVSNVLNRKDTIGLLPTGGGKSLCYQLPCLLQPSINFVVCPIKSLMDDQKDNLEKILITNVNYINSSLEAEERREAESRFEQGRYLFVWISPEKFQIPSFREKVRSLTANFSIAYAVVDEVHCLSEWGHDFRTSYLNLARTIDRLSPKDENGEGRIKFIGLTATASVNVLKDIKIEFSRQKQHLENENIKSLLDYSRKELRFEVIDDSGNKSLKIKEILEDLKDSESFIETTEKAGIVFTPNVNGASGCFQLSNSLNTIYQDKVGWFSGEVPKRDIIDETTGRKTGIEPVMAPDQFNKYKKKIQKDFKDNKYQLLVATKAFGMGIDKENIHYTFHYGLPGSVEALYQEAGRAGRWDKGKAENAGKAGKCFVLFSPETHNIEQVRRLFDKDTTFAELKRISEEVGWNGRDIFKQIFLFTQGQNDIEKDFEIITALVGIYFKERSKVRIFWSDAYSKLGIGSDKLQKAIYRLSLLGIVSDWTTNFMDHFEVHFDSIEERHIIKSISDYIGKYEPEADVKGKILASDQGTTLEKAVHYLLEWTFENIAYSRKQSLKTLSDWCLEFDGSESFKQRIDSYFIFSEATFVLQHIGENPSDYEKWFEVLTEGGQFPDRSGFEKLKDSISRFLESYRNNTGINFLSGFVRLALDQYGDNDGRERFESSLESISRTFTREQKNGFLQRLKVLGGNLAERQRLQLCQSVSRYFPEVLEEFAAYYDLAYLLNDLYLQKIQELKSLNKKLYEQLGKI